jgi:hypothetical protein
MMKEIYQVIWGENSNVVIKDTIELPKLQYIPK